MKYVISCQVFLDDQSILLFEFESRVTELPQVAYTDLKLFYQILLWGMYYVFSKFYFFMLS